MSCEPCSSEHIIKISAKCDDKCVVTFNGKDTQGSVPSGIGLGFGGDYITFSYCGMCGTIQNNFPVLVMAPPVEPIEPPVYLNLGELISDFYQDALNDIKGTAVHIKYRNMLKFLTPSEQEAMDHYWVMYNNMHTSTQFPEFNEYVVFLIDRYKEIEVLEKVMMM